MSSKTVEGVTYDLSDGVTVEELEGEVIQEFKKSQSAFSKGFVRFQPYNQVMPRVYAGVERRVREMEARPDDIWIASFPKCGTTWTEEMVWCIMNDLDYEAAKKTTLDDRIPFVEMVGIWSPDTDDPSTVHDTIKQADDIQGQRLLKTHLSADMLPKQIMEKKSKVIYVTRNPRDVCVSYHSHWKIFEHFTGSFETFMDAFLDDVAGYYTPFFKNVLSFWELQKTADNVMFIFYEDMKRDLPSVIRKVSEFLGKPVAEKDMDALCTHLSFDKMKNNAAVNKQEWVDLYNKTYNMKSEGNAFMRKGQAGNWRSKMTEEQVKRFEEWEKKWLADSDLTFKYD